MQIYETIAQTIVTIVSERGDPAPELKPETPISASGLDSLDIAALVARLEEQLGVDPFAEGNLERYPQTVGETADLYGSKSRQYAVRIDNRNLWQVSGLSHVAGPGVLEMLI